MKRTTTALLITLALISSLLSGYGKKAKESDQIPAPAVETQSEQVATQTEQIESETEPTKIESDVDTTEPTEAKTDDAVVEAAENEAADDGMEVLKAIGDVEVDKGLLNVTMTLPKDLIGETTQEELDEYAKERGYKSVTLNSDGSVTYDITKEQHEEMLAETRKSIDDSMAKIIGSSETPNITNLEANENYTVFTITTKNSEPDLYETFIVLTLYSYGGMYAIFSGEEVDNIHVDYVNADTGEIISSVDSKDMESNQE